MLDRRFSLRIGPLRAGVPYVNAKKIAVDASQHLCGRTPDTAHLGRASIFVGDRQSLLVDFLGILGTAGPPEKAPVARANGIADRAAPISVPPRQAFFPSMPGCWAPAFRKSPQENSKPSRALNFCSA